MARLSSCPSETLIDLGMSHSPCHIPILGPGRVTSECTLCLYLSDGDDEKHYSSSIIGVLAKSELGETG